MIVRPNAGLIVRRPGERVCPSNCDEETRMKIFLSMTALALALCMSGSVMAQNNNEQARHDAAVQAKQQHKADKAQAKADKAEHKALTSHKAKTAARDQDHADQVEQKTPPPQ
jgi:type IV secretory pathway VirB6-like protein